MFDSPTRQKSSSPPPKPHEYNFELWTDPAGKQKYRLPKKWTASSHYSKTLRQVQSQVTPAGQYREYYRAFGRAENVIRSLERRVDPHEEQCRAAVTALQARYRGRNGRKHFAMIRPSLVDARTQREIKKDALARFHAGDVRGSYEAIMRYRGPSLGLGLAMMKCKLLYRLGELSACESAARAVLAREATHLDAAYTLACCLSSTQRFDEAYHVFSSLFRYARVASRAWGGARHVSTYMLFAPLKPAFRFRGVTAATEHLNSPLPTPHRVRAQRAPGSHAGGPRRAPQRLRLHQAAAAQVRRGSGELRFLGRGAAGRPRRLPAARLLPHGPAGASLPSPFTRRASN